MAMIYLSIKELSEEHKLQLDSLLNEISCERVFYWGKESLKEMGKDTSRIKVYIPYFVYGLSIGGTSKEILYEPKLGKEQIPAIEQHSDLNDIYCQTNSDTTLHKPIKDGRYIMLDHDN